MDVKLHAESTKGRPAAQARKWPGMLRFALNLHSAKDQLGRHNLKKIAIEDVKTSKKKERENLTTSRSNSEIQRHLGVKDGACNWTVIFWMM